MTSLLPVVWSLGSNLGDRLATLQAAVAGLAATPGLTVTAVSSVWETDPWGGVDQDDFLNIVVVGRSMLEPEETVAVGHRLEDDHGRRRSVHWGPRTLDVDIVAMGDLVRRDVSPLLPHPRAHERAFVLVPWLEVDPDAVLVGHGRVADLLAHLDVAGVRRRDGLTLAWPGRSGEDEAHD